MPDIQSWAALGVSLVTSLTLLGKAFGYDKRRNEEQDSRLTKIEDVIKEHVDLCVDRHDAASKVQERVDLLTHELKRTRTTLEWLGDCTIAIGTSVGAKFPQRPNP